MKRKIRNHIYRRLFILSFILLPVLSGISLFAQDIQIKINAPESVVAGQRFRVNYVIESKKQEVKEPVVFKNIAGFDILYGPAVSTASSVTINKGERSTIYTSTSSYHLMANKAGKFTLPRAEITIDGKKYKSDTFKIEVKEGTSERPQARTQPQSPSQDVGEIDAFIETVISKTSVNLSDTLMITYRLYTTHNISRILNSDFPPMPGFYSSNITRSRQSSEKKKETERCIK